MTQIALSRAQDSGLSDLEKVWMYLVLTHAEDLPLQQRCVSLSDANLMNMEEGFRKMWNGIFHKHLEVIQMFGRFPHRNAFLSRPSTLEELHFLQDPKYRFDLPVKLEADPLTGEPKFVFVKTEVDVEQHPGSTNSTDLIRPGTVLDLDAIRTLRRQHTLGHVA